MTTLTEKYRKGELPDGWYYIRDEMYKVYPAQYIREYDYIKDKAYADFPHADNLVVDVLCEVPSYKDWENFKKLYVSLEDELADYKERINDSSEGYNKLRIQKNEADEVILEYMAKARQLKELLMSARNYLKSYRDLYSKDNEDVVNFIKEIDQVLQENE